MINRVCDRCIHYDVCLLHEDNFIDDVAKNGFCGKFKDKTNLVEVVRCKDCQCKGAAFCMAGDFPLTKENENCYCSYGERRDT